MCGLFGWQMTGTQVPAGLPAASAILCQCATERGEDSWGVLAGTRVVRGLGSIVRAAFPRQLGTLPSVAGHTRYATTGANTVANAHPFTTGGVVGMHNGIVYNDRDLRAEFDRPDVRVDSEHIFRHIAAGIPLDTIDAYGAIVYRRADSPGSLFMGRFNGGELSVARIRVAGVAVGLMWSSTRKALASAIAFGGFTATYVTIDPGKLYRVFDGDIAATADVLDLSKRPAAPAKWTATPALPWAGTPALPKWAATPLLKDADAEDDDGGVGCDNCGEYGVDCECGSDCYCAHCLRQEDLYWTELDSANRKWKAGK